MEPAMPCVKQEKEHLISATSAEEENSFHDREIINRRAADLLLKWAPLLTKDLCLDCSSRFQSRISELISGTAGFGGNRPENCLPSQEGCATSDFAKGDSFRNVSRSVSNGNRSGSYFNSKGNVAPSSSSFYSSGLASSNSNAMANGGNDDDDDDADSLSVTTTSARPEKRELSRDEREYIRFMNVGRKKDFVCIENVRGKRVNIVKDLELHSRVFSAAEQKRLVEFVFQLQEQGRRKQLKERTYSEPKKWMKGKGRVTIQFGCCYNYAIDKHGNPPGIVPTEEVDPIPPLFKSAIKRMVRWHVLPPSCVPDSCIVNIYDEGDCIPPHIDHHDFVRPFCTVSLLSECSIVFGSNLEIVGPGEFSGSIAIPLPVGSVLILNGNGADVAKHCVPAVPTRRISITFRKMDPSKRPIGFAPEPDLQGIVPLSLSKQGIQSPYFPKQNSNGNSVGPMSSPSSAERKEVQEQIKRFSMDNSDFPPLNATNSGKRPSRTARRR